MTSANTPDPDNLPVDPHDVEHVELATLHPAAAEDPSENDASVTVAPSEDTDTDPEGG